VVEFSNEGLDGITELVLSVGIVASLVVELFLQVDDLLLEFFGLGGDGLLESGSLLLDGGELQVLGLSVLGGEGVSELGEGFLSGLSLVSESLL